MWVTLEGWFILSIEHDIEELVTLNTMFGVIHEFLCWINDGEAES